MTDEAGAPAPRAGEPVYVHGHHESVLRSHRSRTAASSAAYLLAHLRPGQSLLDVGCGPGTITADLARAVTPGRVTAIDIAPEAVQQTRDHLLAAGITTAQAYVTDLDTLASGHPLDGADPLHGPDPELDARVPDGGFDVVHAHQVLQHVVDPVAALGSMRRLCAPSGLVAARDADYAAMTWYPRVPGLDRWLALYRRMARAAGGEPDAGRRLMSWGRAAGFSEVTAGASVWCYATPQSRAWWGGVWAERIVASSIAGQAIEAGAATRADLLEISDAWRDWAAAEDGWFAILHGEIVCRP